MSNLERSILQTIAFFDIFNYPLTETEIIKWLYHYSPALSRAELKNVLASSTILKEELNLREAFYCLKGRENTIDLRKVNNNEADHKFQKALRLVKFLRLVPFIKMVAVCNSLAYSNAKADSDIDFFIVAQKGKIWLARFFAVIITRMIGDRPRPGKTADTYCLSFFVTDDNLNLQSVAYGKNDIYLHYWIKQIMPLYDPENICAQFWSANAWVDEYLPKASANQHVAELKLNKFQKVIARIIGFFGSPPGLSWAMDTMHRQFQLGIISRHMKSMVNMDTRVVVNDKILKFHDTDRREYYFKKWKENLSKILNKYEQVSSTTI